MQFALETVVMERSRQRKDTVHKYGAFLELIKDPLVAVDDGGRVIVSNEAAKRFLRFSSFRNIEGVKSSSEEAPVLFDPGEIKLLIKKAPISNHRLMDRWGRKTNLAADSAALPVLREYPGARLIHFKDLSLILNKMSWTDETIAMVSHELKNPLSAMKNVVNILLSENAGPLTGRQEKFLTAAERSVGRLVNLLENVLDISKLNSGTLSVDRDWICLASFMRETVNSFETLFNLHGVKVKRHLEEGIKKIYADSSKLEQVIINLLSNAVKFTPADGEIVLSAASAGRESLERELRLLPWDDLPKASFLRFAVRDNGIGMNEETLANLFTPYYGQSGKKLSGGSHLGLNICKTLVEIQDGRLQVESRLGIGTEVLFYLPKDERTAYMLHGLRVIKGFIKELQKENRKLFLALIGKESGECWMNMCSSWRTIPEINPADGGYKGEKFLLWPISEYLAAALIIDKDIDSPVDKMFNKNCSSNGAGSYSFDGHFVGASSSEECGFKIETLFNQSMNKLKRAGNPLNSRFCRTNR